MKPDINEIKSTLSKKEFERFGRFINSPFFNTEQRFVSLYNALAEGNPGRKELAEKIFGPGIDPSEDRFRKLVSEFIKLYKRFLAECEFESSDFEQRLMLLKQLSCRNLKKAYEREAEKIEESVQTAGIKDEEYYLKMLEIYNLRYQAEGFNTSSWNDDLSFKIDHYLDRYFASMKLFLYQRIQSIEYLFQPDIAHVKNYFDELNQYIQRNSLELMSEYSDVNLRHMMYKMVESPDSPELLDQILFVLSKYEGNSKVSCNVYYEDLINYYTLLNNLGKGPYDEKIIQLAEIMTSKGYFNTTISSNIYKIVLESAIALTEYKWAETFAENFKDKIKDSNSSSMYASCMGKICFFQGEYGRARSFLKKVEFDDYTRYAEAKLIECRILYEERKLQDLLVLLETVKKYMKAHKEIGISLRGIYGTFLNIMKEIVKLYEKKKVSIDITFDVFKLEEEMLNHKDYIYAKAWLNEKISELKKAGF
ncbi:MAG: hypothetical protein JNK43_00675 [Ignavibacteria bacterium]|nr:hypothetical protein [Ignavibacteria bacterium]